MPRETEPKERIEIGPLGCTIPAYKSMKRPAYNHGCFVQYVAGKLDSHGEPVEGGTDAGKK